MLIRILIYLIFLDQFNYYKKRLSQLTRLIREKNGFLLRYKGKGKGIDESIYSGIQRENLE